MDTDDDGTHALRSLRAASGRRAVVSFLFIFVWAICMTPCFVNKGRTGLNADSSRSHFIVGLCVETGESILTFVLVRAIRVNDGVFCSHTDAFVSKLFLVDLAGCEKVRSPSQIPKYHPNTSRIPSKALRK